jgi:hypothetical protein
MIADLCTTSQARSESCLGPAGPVAVLDRVGVREGQPFILAGDGSYDLQLNRFLRELPSWGVRAENSVLGYARDVMLFVRFLETSRHGKPIWVCDGDDLRAYKRVRLWCGGPGAVSGGCGKGGGDRLGPAVSSGEAAGHEGDEGPLDVGFGVGHEAFVVPRVAAGPSLREPHR